MGGEPFCKLHAEIEHEWVNRSPSSLRAEAKTLRDIPWFRDRWTDTDLGPADFDEAIDALLSTRLTQKFAWRVWGVQLALFGNVPLGSIAWRVGVCRQLIPRWVKRYKEKGLGSLLHPNVAS